jgi:hypothetical protein
MSVDFSRPLCETMVAEMRRRLDDWNLVYLWSVMAFDGGGAVDDSTAYFLNWWDELSLWNKQQVLFSLAPEIERIVSKQAMRMAARARTEEPL